jgi:hypothetical protein
MAEKRKADVLDSVSETRPAKVIKTISSAPVKYTTKVEDKRTSVPIPTLTSLQIPSVLDKPSYQGPKGTSYQEALSKSSDKHATPQFVFPHAAPKTSQPSSAQPMKRVIRKVADQTWEDPTLAEWRDDDFRLFVGDLGNEVSDDTLIKVFSKYPSFLKAKVIRDKRSGKTLGYGFVSFGDPNDFMRAMKEMNGQYIGNRPCKLRKSSWKKRNYEEVISPPPPPCAPQSTSSTTKS